MYDCGQSNATFAIGQWVTFIAYTVILPPYILVGLPANVILLVAFYKHSKKERTYWYQVLLTVSKTLEVTALGGYVLCTIWFVGYGDGQFGWFSKHYALMWVNFTLGVVGHMHFIMTSAMLAVAMAADRVFSLSLPLRYKNIAHKKHQTSAALICFILPTISSVSYAFVGKIVKVDDHYEVSADEVFLASTFGRSCSGVGLFLRIACVAALITLNIVMVCVFRKRFASIAEMTDIREKKEARKLADKTLFLLNIWQSVLIVINQSPHVTLHAWMYIDPTFFRCYDRIAASLADACIFLTDSIDLIGVVAISSNMRRAVCSTIRCKE